MNIARILPAITQKRKIFIFPDMDMLDKWKAMAEGLKYPRIVWMGDYIKENARTDKDDVGDIVLRMWQEGGHVPDANKMIKPSPPPEPPEMSDEERKAMDSAIRTLEIQVAHERLGLTEPNEALILLFDRLDLHMQDETITEPDYIGF